MLKKYQITNLASQFGGDPSSQRTSSHLTRLCDAYQSVLRKTSVKAHLQVFQYSSRTKKYLLNITKHTKIIN